MVVVVPWYLPLRFGRVEGVSPAGICGGRIPPWNYKYLLKKLHLRQFLMYSKDLYYIYLWIGNDICNFTKIAAILNFHVNMPPSWILCVLDLFTKIIQKSELTMEVGPGAKIIKKNTKLDSKQTSNVPC